MSTRKHIRRKVMTEHRNAAYDRSLDKLIKGEVPPDYVHERWNKLKEIK